MSKSAHIVMAGSAMVAAALLLAGPASAQTPIRGGTFKFSVPGAPTSLDCGSLVTTPHIGLLSPGYSLLLRFDPKTYPEVVGDAAESYTESADHLTWTFKLRPNVKFHDGKTLTSEDVKASYQRYKDPPAGVSSLRGPTQLAAVASIDTPDALTVVFKLSQYVPTMKLNFASPFNCIYSAADLAKDPKFPINNLNGTGPYKLVQYTPGSNIEFTRFDNYFVKGADGKSLPYLDGVQGFFLASQPAATAISGKSIDGQLSNISPVLQEQIQAVRGNSLKYEFGPYNVVNFLDVNTTKPPFDDKRVRNAISLAIDRRSGSLIMEKGTVSKGFGILFPAGVPVSLTDDEIGKLPGYVADKTADRAEARRLLAEAGQSNLKVTLLNSAAGEPYASIAVVVADALKQIGVTLEQRMVDGALYGSNLAAKNYELAVDAYSTISTDPSEVLIKYLPNAGNNYTGFKDQMLQDLYDKQALETDPAKRRELVTSFEKRVLDTNMIIPLFRSVNIAAYPPNLQNVVIRSSPTIGVDYRDFWWSK